MILTICSMRHLMELFFYLLVQFSNGIVKDPDKLRFSMYKNTDERNPRKKNRRILVAESSRLSYVGDNFGPASMKCNNMCQYFVGVLNKQTMQMEVHKAQMFNLQPVVPDKKKQNYHSLMLSRTQRIVQNMLPLWHPFSTVALILFVIEIPSREGY
uniref:Uncharacterized protein n=1 Tax=Periophthalmus magnuspinnatus TaxID=409849 RepID=A0A3B4BMU7_9GOBI